MQRYILVVSVTVETSCQEMQIWLHKQLFGLQETLTDFEYFLLLVRNIDLVMSVWLLICQIVNNYNRNFSVWFCHSPDFVIAIKWCDCTR